MFMQEKAGPSDGPGAGRFARYQVDGKLWQKKAEKKAGGKASGKLTRKKPLPNVLHVGALSIKS